MPPASDTPVTPSPQSPCVRNCCLDDDDICLGCFRSLQEITEWGQATPDRRKTILDNCQSRKSRYKQQRKGFPSWE